jgi:saccharopine dehydrogenase (NADP+, L-glutamate forming)
MAAMDREVRSKGLCFLNEMGLDPGIDHMSAMELIVGLKSRGAQIHSFQSYCGGLVAEAFDNNPLHYKFSWNPRNVILAGQGEGAVRFRQTGIVRLMPYSRLFRNPVLLRLGERSFEGYPNRDSIKYMPVYGLNDCEEFIRGTLRKPGFCAIWQAFVDLGLTDDKSQLSFREGAGWNEWLLSFLSGNDSRLSPQDYIGLSYGEEVKNAFSWLGLFSAETLPMSGGTPAAYLQALLEPQLALDAADTDAVVMVHKIGYRLEGKSYELSSSLYLEGEDSVNTAMAQTVGLPLGIAALMLMSGRLKRTGVCMPISEDIYQPVLKELDTFGIRFKEETTEITS